MSLISDALRKARQEAAEREAKEQGLETPVVAGYWKRGGRLGFGLVLGAAIAVGAAVIGGGMVWWVLEDRSGLGAVVEALDEGVLAAVVVAQNPADISHGARPPERPSEKMVPTVSAVESTSNGLEAPPAIEGDRVNEAEVTDRTPDLEEGVPVDVASPRPQPTPADGEFVGEAHIGGVTLTLDYLVYRKENPFAQINGRNVRVGAVIEDYVVEAITIDSVVLTQGDAKIVLRVQ